MPRISLLCFLFTSLLIGQHIQIQLLLIHTAMPFVNSLVLGHIALLVRQLDPRLMQSTPSVLKWKIFFFYIFLLLNDCLFLYKSINFTLVLLILLYWLWCTTYVNIIYNTPKLLQIFSLFRGTEGVVEMVITCTSCCFLCHL